MKQMVTMFIGAESVIVSGNGEYIFRPAVILLIPESAKPSEEDSEPTKETIETVSIT